MRRRIARAVTTGEVIHHADLVILKEVADYALDWANEHTGRGILSTGGANQAQDTAP
jgi:hypothetical protein